MPGSQLIEDIENIRKCHSYDPYNETRLTDRTGGELHIISETWLSTDEGVETPGKKKIQ